MHILNICNVANVLVLAACQAQKHVLGVKKVQT
jgi:hypothetical protein